VSCCQQAKKVWQNDEKKTEKEKIQKKSNFF
jgi:hypothetical protein